MNPLLLTLYGDKAETLGESNLILAIIMAAITNVVGDVAGVSGGSETWQQAVANTMFPYVGGAIGSWLWPVENAPAGPVDTGAATDANQITITSIAIVGASVLFVAGGTVYSLVKKG